VALKPHSTGLWSDNLNATGFGEFASWLGGGGASTGKNMESNKSQTAVLAFAALVNTFAL
jgi:hypothetical protein